MPRADQQLPNRTQEQESILRAFGRRLAELRSSTVDPNRPPRNDGSEWTYAQDHFARHVGMHRTVVSQIERGQVNVTLLTIHRLAEGLGITIAELTDGIDTGA